MFKIKFKSQLFLTLVLTGILLSACGPVKVTTAPIESITPGFPSQPLELPGDYKNKVQEYLSLALSAPSPLREEYQLRAIAALLHLKQSIRAKSLINEIHLNSLTPVLKFHRKLLLAQIALLEGNPKKSIASLRKLEPSAPELALQYYETRARAYSMLGNYLESARSRIKMGSLLTTPQVADLLFDKDDPASSNNVDKQTPINYKIQENRKLILSTLQQLSVPALNQLKIAPAPDILSGWMELASIQLKTRQNHEQLKPLISQWKNRYPSHPANESLANKLLYQVQKIQSRPDTIALLLPFTGKLSNTASAIRDGLLATHFQQDSISRSSIRLYDTGDNTQDIQEIYFQAVQDGATFVIGPLDKNAVTHLAYLDSLPVPVLALNTIDTQQLVPDNFYQFGLSPEDEARQVAERASLEGLVNAIVITPEGHWGRKGFYLIF